MYVGMFVCTKGTPLYKPFKGFVLKTISDLVDPALNKPPISDQNKPPISDQNKTPISDQNKPPISAQNKTLIRS